MKLIFYYTICLCISAALSVSAQDTLQSRRVSDTTQPHQIHCGSPAVASVFIVEGFAALYSVYAADKTDYGDKAMGALYAGCSVGLLILTAAEWKHGTGKDMQTRIGDAVTMLGISYGLSRLATYNLLEAGNDSRLKRFDRNMLEFNAACIVPFVLGVAAEKIVGKRLKKLSSKTNLYINGKQVLLRINL